MSPQHAEDWTRRAFLGGLTLAGTAARLGLYSRPVAAEPLPETTTIRLVRSPAICIAPYYIAGELLQGEGFTEVHHFQMEAQLSTSALLSGEVDIVLNFVGPLLVGLDTGDPLIILAGGHVGCFELFGTDHVRAIRDLKGKTVAVPQLESPHRLFLASMASYVGLDP
jgi:NitT/TauT family transport system substrate-binding protein